MLVSLLTFLLITYLVPQNENLQVLDFSIPIFSSKYHLFMTKPKESVSWTSYFEVYSDQFWFVVSIFFVLLSLWHYLVFKVSQVNNSHFAFGTWEQKDK